MWRLRFYKACIKDSKRLGGSPASLCPFSGSSFFGSAFFDVFFSACLFLLAGGKITQEEYNSYYPYDGLGYYSVFVETDLNKASTTSGRKLGSEDGIADYIAGMMLLETEPVFYIEYAGVYNLNGTDFYEFRCYR